MIRLLLVIVVFFTGQHMILAQEYIRNGSFEGFVPQFNNVPRFWDICHPLSTPDIQPIDSRITPKEGRTYIGLAIHGKDPQDSILAFKAEAIGQRIEPLTPGFEYLISVHLTYDRLHQSTTGESEAPGKLNVYIGDGICFDTLRIWQSPIIDHDDWKVYERNYIAKCFNNYIILEADHGDILAREAAYLLVDYVSLIPVNNESALDTIDCGEEMEMPDTTDSMEIGPCSYFIPNAITPNNDGLNDFLEVQHTCQFSTFDMSIYNRWGNRVFHTENPSFHWEPDARDTGPFLYNVKVSFTDLTGSEIMESRTDLLYIIP